MNTNIKHFFVSKGLVREGRRLLSVHGPVLLLILLAGLATSGCMSVKSYIDPQYRHATFADIKATSNPVPVVVKVSFQVNGKPKLEVDAVAQSRAMKVLRATHMFAERSGDKQASSATLELIVNNIADTGDASAKGIATGLTFGAAGSEVVDNYEMTAVYTPAQGKPVSKVYKHSLHSTIGAHAAPLGMEPVPTPIIVMSLRKT